MNQAANREAESGRYLAEQWLKIKQNKCYYYSCIFIMTSLTLGYLIVTVYLGIFAYANPDPDSCYYTIGLDRVSRQKDTVKFAAIAKGIAEKKGYPVNIASLFRIFFKWGFWNNITLVLIIFTAWVLSKWRPDLAKFQLMACTAMALGSSLFHFFLGLSWRFSLAGSIASGSRAEKTPTPTEINTDGYQMKGGQFMKILLLIELPLYLVLPILGVCIGCTWMICFRQKND